MDYSIFFHNREMAAWRNTAGISSVPVTLMPERESFPFVKIFSCVMWYFIAGDLSNVHPALITVYDERQWDILERPRALQSQRLGSIPSSSL